MFDTFLDGYPWLAYLVGILVVLSATECGRRIGDARRRRNPDAMSGEVSAIAAAALGLFALMMGFTFSMAVSRLDYRVRQVVAEANAIGTTALRAEFLPEPHASKTMGLLRDYVNIRVALMDQRPSIAGLNAAVVQSTKIQRALWTQAQQAMAEDPRSLANALFVSSLNEMIDVQTVRIFAGRNHVPDVVIILLYVIAMVALGYAGYASGLEGKQGRIPYSIMAVLVGCVIGVTVDIDRPQSGLLIVNQAPVRQLLPMLER